MKTTFRFIIAAMAAISVFSSCQKELVGEISNNTDEGIRVISVQFDNSTKASLNGLKPTFNGNDKIRVSNTEKSEECTITIDNGGTPTFTTTLPGALTAIYPADAAVLSSDGEKPIVSPYFNVSASQDGTIAKAIIAKADISAQSSSATFDVQTALFQITPPTGVKTFTITSLKPVVDGVARTGTAKAINTDGQTDDDKCVITVGNSDSTTFYVALVPGVNLSDLSFEYITDAANGLGAMKGIPAKDITAAGKTDATAANTKYTINKENWHPYVTIGGKKWATENVGATDSDPYGTYFMWGETNGIKPSASSFSFPTSKYYTADNNSWTQSSGFDWANCPWTNGTYIYYPSNKDVFTKYTNSDDYAKSGTADNKTKLDLADDAAYANWGGAWRMPTGGTDANSDFTALAKAAKSDYSSGSISPSSQEEVPTSRGVYYYNVDGSKGLYFVDESGNKLFFPAAGYGFGIDLNDADSDGDYWSSSLDASSPDSACGLDFGSSSVYPQNNCGRYYGFSVRPVSDL